MMNITLSELKERERKEGRKKRERERKKERERERKKERNKETKGKKERKRGRERRKEGKKERERHLLEREWLKTVVLYAFHFSGAEESSSVFWKEATYCCIWGASTTAASITSLAAHSASLSSPEKQPLSITAWGGLHHKAELL